MVVSLLALGVGKASGQSTWSNPAGGLFHDGANWDGGTAPISFNSATFDLSDSYAVEWTGDTSGRNLSVNSGIVTFFSTGETRKHLLSNFFPAGTADLGVSSGSLRLGRSVGESFELETRESVRISNGGNLQVNFGSRLTAGEIVCVGSTGGGSMQINSGGSVVAARGFVGGRDSSGNVTISDTGSSWTVAGGELRVGGLRGNADLEVLAGGTLAAANIQVGGLEANTVLSVSGAGSQIDVTSQLTLGSGNSRLNVISGGSLTSTDAALWAAERQVPRPF